MGCLLRTIVIPNLIRDQHPKQKDSSDSANPELALDSRNATSNMHSPFDPGRLPLHRAADVSPHLFRGIHISALVPSSATRGDRLLLAPPSPKKLSQNTLIGEVKFLLLGETGARLWARLRGKCSTAVAGFERITLAQQLSPHPNPLP